MNVREALPRRCCTLFPSPGHNYLQLVIRVDRWSHNRAGSSSGRQNEQQEASRRQRRTDFTALLPLSRIPWRSRRRRRRKSADGRFESRVIRVIKGRNTLGGNYSSRSPPPRVALKIERSALYRRNLTLSPTDLPRHPLALSSPCLTDSLELYPIRGTRD